MWLCIMLRRKSSISEEERSQRFSGAKGKSKARAAAESARSRARAPFEAPVQLLMIVAIVVVS